jgi:DNA polymerase-3 subunit epsilon
MKYFFFDLETTGTKYWKNGIHQISGLIEIDGEIKEKFDFREQRQSRFV